VHVLSGGRGSENGPRPPDPTCSPLIKWGIFPSIHGGSSFTTLYIVDLTPPRHVLATRITGGILKMASQLLSHILGFDNDFKQKLTEWKRDLFFSFPPVPARFLGGTRIVVLVPVGSLPPVTCITSSESVVPDRASSSEQSSSRPPLEPPMQPEPSSPCWLILSRSLGPSPGYSASPSCEPSSL